MIEQKYKLIVFIFFAIYLCIGLSIFRDYGISWDEGFQRRLGTVTLNYILGVDKELLSYYDRDHGPVFETLLVVIERVINPFKNTQLTFFMRHLFIFLLFYVGAIFFYRLCKNSFGSYKIGLLASLFLILSPRIFAHSFYNSKDIVFLSVFIISIYTLIRFLDNTNFNNAVIHSLICAILIGVRILGIIVPLFTIAFFITDAIIKDKKINYKKISNLIFYIIFSIIFTIVFWPLLWTKPIYHFIETFKQMQHYPWQGGVLYLGNYIAAEKLPWHYIPVWIAISTPILYLLFFSIGFIFSIKEFLVNPLAFYLAKRNNLIFLAWFFSPLLIVIVLKSVLYDCFRHLFFIYPAFLIISLTGLVDLFKFIQTKFQGLRRKTINIVFVSIVIISLAWTAYSMIKIHPYQNVYFNILVGGMKNAKNNFELDYWGLSYRKALEYIVKNDSSQIININVANPPGILNAYMLPSKDKKRLVFVESPEEAKYFLSNFRDHKEDYPYENEFYSIKIGGEKIMVVYKMY